MTLTAPDQQHASLSLEATLCEPNNPSNPGLPRTPTTAASWEGGDRWAKEAGLMCVRAKRVSRVEAIACVRVRLKVRAQERCVLGGLSKKR